MNEKVRKLFDRKREPTLFITITKVPVISWEGNDGILRNKVPFGDTYQERLEKCITYFEDMGLKEAKIIFRKNHGD